MTPPYQRQCLISMFPCSLFFFGGGGGGGETHVRKKKKKKKKREREEKTSAAPTDWLSNHRQISIQVVPFTQSGYFQFFSAKPHNNAVTPRKDEQLISTNSCWSNGFTRAYAYSLIKIFGWVELTKTNFFGQPLEVCLKVSSDAIPG